MTDKTLAQRRRRVRLRDLETLLAMVQAGGLRKAAGALHLSQPAISKAMRELEDALGVRLLERGRRGTEPTIHGEVLVRRAQAMLDELHNALLELDWLSDPEAGEVRVGGGDVQQAGILAMTAQGLLDSHPHMRITFEAAQSRELIEQMLPQRLVDFAVTRPATLPLPSDIEAEPLYCERLHIVVGKAHALAGRRKLTLAALQGERWILSRNELMAGSPLLQAFADAGLPLPARRVESSTSACASGCSPADISSPACRTRCCRSCARPPACACCRCRCRPGPRRRCCSGCAAEWRARRPMCSSTCFARRHQCFGPMPRARPHEHSSFRERKCDDRATDDRRERKRDGEQRIANHDGPVGRAQAIGQGPQGLRAQGQVASTIHASCHGHDLRDVEHDADRVDGGERGSDPVRIQDHARASINLRTRLDHRHRAVRGRHRRQAQAGGMQ